jgi:outer membrane protein W
MKKLRKISAVVAILAGVGVNANAGDWFIGAEVGHSEMDVKASSSYRSISTEVDGSHQALKIGKYLDNNIRVGAMVYRFNEDDDVDVSAQSIFADYLFGNEKLKPFIGVSVMNFKYKATGLGADFSKNDIQLDGLSFGGQFGLNYEINDKVNFEAGYKILNTNFSDEVKYLPTGTNIKFETDTINSWYFGVNYRF